MRVLGLIPARGAEGIVRKNVRRRMQTNVEYTARQRSVPLQRALARYPKH